MLEVRAKFTITATEGQQIQAKESMTYLGSTLYADGGSHNELAKKLGIAWADFCKLAQVWRHTRMPKGNMSLQAKITFARSF